jgi:casein kinase II subunit beta
VHHYSRAAEIIKGGSCDLRDYSQEQRDRLEHATRKLYGLLHQRFCLTDDGVHKMANKVNNGIYGRCPRVACKNAKMIPMGWTIEPEQAAVRAWCPKCHDVYETKSDLDGAYFGPDLPLMYIKIMGGSLKFQVYSKMLAAYQDTDGKPVPRIRQRLVKWGEIAAEEEKS